MHPGELATDLGVPKWKIIQWIKRGKLVAELSGQDYEIAYDKNHEFILDQLKQKRERAWTPKEIEGYSEWHQLFDELSWLIKICYSSKDEIKKRSFRLDRLYINYLIVHSITPARVRPLFPRSGRLQRRKATDDLKRGWYNELSFLFPLKNSTLGLSFSDISINQSISEKRFAFPSWRIVSSYYSLYFYIRAMALLKQPSFRLQEHASAIASFKNNLLHPLESVLWKFPLNISYTQEKTRRQNPSLLRQLSHTRYGYCKHPRAPWLTADEVFAHIYSTFRRKGKTKSRQNKYTVIDYMHDFRIWANYLNIDDLLRLSGSGYKSFLDQNLSLLLFFIGGLTEICYIAAIGEEHYLTELKTVSDLMIKNNSMSGEDFRNTALFQRHSIYRTLGIVTGEIKLNLSSNQNALVLSPSLTLSHLKGK